MDADLPGPMDGRRRSHEDDDGAEFNISNHGDEGDGDADADADGGWRGYKQRRRTPKEPHSILSSARAKY